MLAMPKRNRRLVQGYQPLVSYAGHPLRDALRNAPNSKRQAVAGSAALDTTTRQRLRVADSSHLLVKEEFELTRGGSVEVEFFHPVRLAQHVLDHAEELSQHYGEAAADHGQQPWRLLFGCDEQTPGSKVNHDNRRKNMCGVMNFIDVGIGCLEQGESWFVPVTLRSNFSKRVKGGWSAILRRVLTHALVGPHSFSECGLLARYTRDGVLKCAHIKASMHTILTDGEGIQFCMQWNGHASMRPTFDFSNVFMKNSGMEHVDGYVDVTCSDLTQMRRWTHDHWLRNVDSVLDARERHERGELSTAGLKSDIKAAGFCVTKQGLLADPVLREVVSFLGAFKYDYMHTAFQDGFMSNAMYLIVDAVLQIRHGNRNSGEPLVRFLKGVEFPFQRGRKDSTLQRIFGEKMMPKHQKKKSIVANAANQLTLYKVIEFWAVEATTGHSELLEHCAVYSAACKVADVFREIRHRRLDTQTAGSELIALIGRWQDLHKAKYGTVYFKPKFFWIWSIALTIAESPVLFDMFFVERQHKRVKVHAETVCNTATWERSVLMRVVDSQVLALQHFSLSRGIIVAGSKKARVNCGGTWADAADSLVCNGMLIHCDDIVARSGRLGLVTACCETDNGSLLVLARRFRATPFEKRYELTSQEEVWPVSELKVVIAWRYIRFPSIVDVVL